LIQKAAEIARVILSGIDEDDVLREVCGASSLTFFEVIFLYPDDDLTFRTDQFWNL
jgi:hypothetical protein